MKDIFKCFIIRMLTRFFSLFHPIKKRILLYCFGGSRFADSQKAIYFQLLENEVDYEIFCLVDCPPMYQKKNYKSIIFVKNNIFNFSKLSATSFCIINNYEYTKRFLKRHGQFYIQVYHGDRGMKKVSYESHSFDGKAIDYKVTDLGVCGSKYGENLFRNALKYNGEMLKVGLPRNDKLLNLDNSTIDEIRETIRIPDSACVLTYAPTFRDNQKDTQRVLIDLQMALTLLENKTGCEWVCLVRKHNAVASLSYHFSDKIIDVSAYDDMADILSVTDFLITDYSSCAGDFLLKNKPMVLCAYDYDDYKNSCRDLKFDLEDAGYIVARNDNELKNIISTYDIIDFQLHNKKVYDYYVVSETGMSAKAICEVINVRYKEWCSK